MADLNYIYFVDENGNYYVDETNNYYVSGTEYLEPLYKYEYYKYTPQISDGSKYKSYTAYIRDKNGNLKKFKPYIYTKVEIAVAGLATAGISRVGTMPLEERQSIAGIAIVGVSRASA